MIDTKMIRKIITLFVIIIYSNLLFSQEHTETQSEGKKIENNNNEHHTTEKVDPIEAVMEHIADSYDWHIIDYNGHPISLPLPIILYSQNLGVNLFMSSKFEHGHAEYNGFKIAQEGENKSKIVELVTDTNGSVAEILPIDFSITKNVTSLFMSALLLLLVFLSVARAYKKRGNGTPKGLQAFIEPLIIFVKDEIAVPNIGEKKYKKFLPYLLTVFFFIWINNMIGLIPIFPGSANVTGNIAVTFVLAIFTMLIVNLNGNKNYWRHIFAMPGVPVVLLPILTVVEIIGVLAKPFALMIRLFANMLAGHIIVLSLISLIFISGTLWVAPVSVIFVIFMDVLELFVAALQAYVFTILSALFIGLAVQEHH
jgi:F-type H+-transporting ATPase subunit a